MVRALVLWLLVFFIASAVMGSDGPCPGQKAALEKKATQHFLDAIKQAAFVELEKLYAKNNLARPVGLTYLSQSPRGLLYQVEAGKDSIKVRVKFNEKIKVVFWPSKQKVDVLGRPMGKAGSCVAHAFTYASSKEKIFLDLENAETQVVIASFSLKNLVIEEFTN